MNKKILAFIFMLIGIASFNFSYLKSLSVMYFYNIYNDRLSIMERKNFEVTIPGGLSTKEKDWYPFVMTYQDESIASSIEENIDLTILYNFGAFENGRSLFYKTESDYFSSFYGAYIIESKDKDRKYGFANDEIDVGEITKVATHDMEVLVLESIGCTDAEVSFQGIAAPKLTNYLNYEDWVVMDSTILARSPLHTVENNYMAYIQYGKPPKSYTGENFPRRNLAGRIYCRYFPEYNVTILLYIIAPNIDVLNKTDKQILSKTKIK